MTSHVVYPSNSDRSRGETRTEPKLRFEVVRFGGSEPNMTITTFERKFDEQGKED